VKIVTAKELGQYLKLSESTIYKLAGNGEIPGFRIGDSWRFDMEEILLTIREQKTNRVSTLESQFWLKEKPIRSDSKS
jgi:excisionase family DNA binding protein